MKDEQKQDEDAIEDPTQDTKAEWFEVDEELRRDSLRIARYVLRRMNGDSATAEDLTQTALLKYLMLDEDRRKHIGNPTGYLYRIMMNEVLNQFRKQPSYVSEPLESFESLHIPDLERKFADDSDFNIPLLLREIWGQIEGEDRRLFEFLTFGYTGREIAARLDISEDAARQRVSRLKAKIKAILAGKRVFR